MQDVVGGAAAADPAPDIAALLKKVETEAAELRDAWLRSRAEMENMRKQAAADVARAHKYGIERFADELLAVKDSLESSLAAENASREALRAGVELTLKQLAAAFEKSQVTEIEAQGRKFDPHRHQAMAMVESAEPRQHGRAGVPERVSAGRPRAPAGDGRRGQAEVRRGVVAMPRGMPRAA